MLDGGGARPGPLGVQLLIQAAEQRVEVPGQRATLEPVDVVLLLDAAGAELRLALAELLPLPVKALQPYLQLARAGNLAPQRRISSS